MKVPLLLISFVLFLSANAQKVEFELGLQVGISTLATRERSIQTFNENQGLPKKEDWIHSNSIWNTKQFDVNIYFEEEKKFAVNFGLRMFQYGWKVDTISTSVYTGSFNPPSGSWTTYYGRQEAKLAFLLPKIGFCYDIQLSESLSIRNTVSIGATSFLDYRKQKSYAYNGGQSAFSYLDYGLDDGDYSFDFRRGVFDINLQSVFTYHYKLLSIFIGPSLYYYSDKWTNYLGLHLDTGLALRLKKRPKE